MPSISKRILLLYTDQYYFTKQIYPFGLDLIAGHLRNYGHTVTLDYPFLPEPDLETNLTRIIRNTNPDFIGLGLRNLDTTLSCEPRGDYAGPDYRTFYFLPSVERIVGFIRVLLPRVPIIIGGGAFTVSPQAVLRRLDLRYGIVGEGAEPLRRFIEAWPDEKQVAKVPNLIYGNGDGFSANPRLPFTFEEHSPPLQRARKFNYAYETAGMPVQVKRGCNRDCSYCVEPLIEGRQFVFRDPDAVIEELRYIADTHSQVRRIFFVDTEFNIPDLDYAALLVRKIIASRLHERFHFSSQFLPHPLDRGFAKLLAEAGFSIILTCDSFAGSVLANNHTPYRRKHIIEALELCGRFGLDCSINLIFGLPGETHATIDQTLETIRKYPADGLRSYECTFGGRVYQGTPLCRWVAEKEARRHLFGRPSEGFLEPLYYCSPESPFEIKTHIEKNAPFLTPHRSRDDSDVQQRLAVCFLADQSRWEAAVVKFLESDLYTRSAIYDYLFRTLAKFGETERARTVSEQFLRAILESEDANAYRDQIPLIQYYLGLLGSRSH